MSLVRQALAKAEREAAARDAREKGLPENLSAAGQPWRAPRRRSPAATVVVIALALAAAAGAGYWLSRPAALPPLPPAAGPSAPPQAASALPTNASAAVATAPAPSAAATPAPSAAAPQPAPPQPTTAPARAAAAVAAPVAESIATRELPLDGGRKLGLGGIAWSEVAPLAYLNGRLVGVGESVEGYRVARIERDRVHLEKEGHTVVLLLRAAP